MPPLIIWGVAVTAEELLALGGLLTAGAIVSTQQMQNARTGAASSLHVGAMTEACSTCDPPPDDKCKNTRDEIHRLMYGRKGEGSMEKGIFQRREEQIAGEYGPGAERLSTQLSRDGTRRVFRQTTPWDTHMAEIGRLQARIGNLRTTFNSMGCGNNPDAALNNKDVERVLNGDFNPRPSDWKGPSP